MKDRILKRALLDRMNSYSMFFDNLYTDLRTKYKLKDTQIETIRYDTYYKLCALDIQLHIELCNFMERRSK